MLEKLTDNTKDFSDVGDKDDEYVDQDEENNSDGDVASPVERFVREQQLLHSTTDLNTHTNAQSAHCA